MVRRLAAVILMVLAVTACGGSDDTDQVPTSTVDGTSTSTDAPATGGGESLFGSFDHPIAGVAAESGGGLHPLLEWTEVPGADHYAVYLYAPDGEPYWVWMGRATSVHVGGEPQLVDGAVGPAVADGMSWIVIAYDDSQVPIAVSPELPIAP